MLHRVFSTAWNRIGLCEPLVKVIRWKQLTRKSSIFMKQTPATALSSRRLDHIINHELCTKQEPNINSIKNAFCNELCDRDIGDYVQIRGVVKYVKKGCFVIVKDKTGSAKLIFDKNREDLMEWLENLKNYSYIKVIGIVRRKEAEDSDKQFEIEVQYVVSFLPPTQKGMNGNERNERQEKDLMDQGTNSEGTITCSELSKKEIGKIVQIFGLVNRIDNDRKSFILGDVHGSIKVVPNTVLSQEVQKLKTGDVVVVQGTVGYNAMPTVEPQKLNPDTADLKISANFVKKLNEENYSEMRAPDVNYYTLRTHNCGQLDASYVGQHVRLMGWVVYIRMNMFILLQDKYGLVQLKTPEMDKEIAQKLEDLSLESVISVEGTVSLRPPGNANKAMKTGEIEVEVTNLTLINKAGMLPFYIKDAKPHRSIQLEYRYLDIRHSAATRMNLEFRCETLHKMRKFLIERAGFVEIETPTLFCRTPGGAQEFIVPTRKKGEFYALAQSPQQFKQLLMVGSIDRYFQIARCYRDETGKKDRQPEFTQLDVEMSFCNREGVIKLIEDIVKFVWPQNLASITFPFPRMTYEEAMALYGTDKPDTRFDWKINDLTDVFRQAGKSCSEKIQMEKYMDMEDFTALILVVKKGVGAFVKLKQLAEDLALAEDCKVFVFKLETMDKLDVYLNKLFVQPVSEGLKKSIDCEAQDVVYLGFGQRHKLLKLFGLLRSKSANKLEEFEIPVIDRNQAFNFLWVVDFPLFEEVNGVIQSVHHPFTQPHPEDLELINSDPLKVRSLHYDLILNGNEIGGGSIRIDDPELQKKVLCDILKLDKSYFSHLLLALTHGCPIHGGFALGIDRFISILRGTQSIMDVIAFPKSNSGRDLLSKAPCDIPQADKDLYHIQ